jgi:hypothetical protein
MHLLLAALLVHGSHYTGPRARRVAALTGHLPPLRLVRFFSLSSSFLFRSLVAFDLVKQLSWFDFFDLNNPQIFLGFPPHIATLFGLVSAI